MPLPFAPLGSNRDRGTPAPRMPFSPPSYRDPASSQGAIAAGVRASFVEDAAKEEAKRDQIAIQNESLAQRERAAQQRQIDQAARTQETEAKRVAAEAAKTKRADDNRELARAEFQAAALPPVMTPLQRADLEAEHTKKDKALRARAAARLQETLLTDPEANATTGGFLGMGGEPTPRAAEIAQRLTTLADPANLNDSDLEEFRKIEPTAFDERDTLKKRLDADSVAQTQRDTVTRSVARAKALKAGVPEAELDTLVPPTGALPGADPWQRVAQAGALERDNAQVAQLAQGIEAGKTELADIDAQIEGITAEASKGGSATQVMQSQEAIMQLRQQRDQKAQALQATIERHNSQLTAIEAKSRALNEQAEAAKAPVADEAPKPAVPLASAKAAAKLEADGSYSTSQIDNLQSLSSAGVKAYWADPQTTTKATPESREAKTKAVNDSIDTVQKLGADLTASAQEIQRRIEDEVRSGRLAPEAAQREQEKAFAEYEKSHEEQIVARGEYLHSALRDFSEGQIDADTLNAVYHAAGGSQTGVEAFAELQTQLKKDAEHVDALTAVILGEDGKGSADPGLNGQLLGLAATAAEGSAKYAQWLNAGDYPQGMSQGEITASESNAQAGAEDAKKAKAEMERLRTEQHNKLAAELVKRGADAGQIPGLIAQAELQSLAKARPGIASVVASRGGITAFTAEKLPFVGGLVEAARILPYAETALKLENGEAVTPEEMQALGEFVRFTQEKPSFMASVTDGVASLPGFAIELYSTAGIAGAVRKGGNKAIKEVLERVATKQGRARLAAQMAKSSADNVVAAWSKNNAKKAFGVKLLRGLAEEAVRLPVASAGRIVSKYTQDLATEGVNVTNEDGHMAAVIDSDQRSKPLLRVANAVIDSYIENVSERSGFLLGKIPGGKFLASKLSALSKAAKSKLVSVAMFKAFVRANPGAAPGKIAKILKSANIGSVPEEMFEERLGSAARDVWNGLSGKGWESTVIPSPEDFGVEFLTFLVPGAHAAIQTQRHFGKLDRAITASDSEATSHMDGFASDPAAHAQRLSQLVGAPISADDITRATDLVGPLAQSDTVRKTDKLQADYLAKSEQALNDGKFDKASEYRQMALEISRNRSRGADGELMKAISAAAEIDNLHTEAETVRTQAAQIADPAMQAAEMQKADDMELMGDRISALVKVATGREAVLTQNEKEALNHTSMKPAVVEENGALIITDEARDQMEQFAPTAAKYVKQSETMRREQLGQAAAVAAQPATQEAPTPTAAPAEQGTAPAPSTAPAPAATAAEPQWTATGDKGTVVSIPASEAKTRAQAEAKLVSKLPKGENLRGGTLQKPKAPKPTPEATTAAPEPAPIDYGTGETFDSGKFAEAAKTRAAKLKNPKAKAHYERVVDAIAKAVKSRGKAFPNGVKLDYTMKDGGGAMLKGGALVVNPDLIGTQTTELSDDELNAWVSAVSSEEFIHLAQVQSLSTKQAEQRWNKLGSTKAGKKLQATSKRAYFAAYEARGETPPAQTAANAYFELTRQIIQGKIDANLVTETMIGDKTFAAELLDFLKSIADHLNKALAKLSKSDRADIEADIAKISATMAKLEGSLTTNETAPTNESATPENAPKTTPEAAPSNGNAAQQSGKAPVPTGDKNALTIVRLSDGTLAHVRVGELGGNGDTLRAFDPVTRKPIKGAAGSIARANIALTPIDNAAPLSKTSLSNSATSIDNIDSLIANGGGQVGVINNGRKVKFKQFSMTIDGDTAEVVFVEIDTSERGNGLGLAAYESLGKALAAKGIVLQSSKAQYANGRSVWKKLAQKGLATKGAQGVYFFNQQTLSESPEITQARKALADAQERVRISRDAVPGVVTVDMPAIEARDQAQQALNSLLSSNTSIPSSVDIAANEAATSPQNNKPEPTDAQKEAGNYEMGHLTLGGMDISIENPAGSVRSGKDKDGETWQVTMASHYGYVKGSEGKDGDHIDIFITPGTPANYSGQVFVVNQMNDKGEFDEHKAVTGVGINSFDDARAEYLKNYSPGWKGDGSIAMLPQASFAKWVTERKRNGEAKSPFMQESPHKPKATKTPTPKASNQTPSSAEAPQDKAETSAEYRDAQDKARKALEGLFAPARTANDADYLAAVERGDMETAQRMVDDAVKVAAQRASVAFDVEDPKLATKYRGMEGYGVWMLPDGRIIPVENHTATAKQFFGTSDSDEAISDAFGSQWAIVRAIKGGDFRWDNNVLNIESGRLLNSIQSKNLKDWAIYHGYEIKKTLGFAGQKPPPVTYDSAGNVIPLSQRFDAGSDSILYAPARSSAKITHTFDDGYALTGAGLHEISAPVRAFHGTPHKVDKFSLDKIGTGEGAQAYGWGLYFAESRDVGEGYRDKLAQWTLLTSDGKIYDDRKELKNLNVRAVLNKNGSIDEAVARARSVIESIPGTQGAELALADIATLEKLKQSGGLTKTKGNLYTVELLPDESEFLDWDKPISEQSNPKLAALRKAHRAFLADPAQRISDKGKNGDSLYHMLERQKGSAKAASEYLASIGIPGIKYLDGNSRDNGKGTRNYVIFDENLVRILEENGKPVDPILSPARASTNIEQLAVPENRTDAIIQTARSIIAAKIRTPEGLAAFLDDTFAGKARGYSEAIWDAIGMVDKTLRGTHDWNAIYAKIDSPQEAPTETPQAIAEMVRDALLDGREVNVGEMENSKQRDETIELGITMAARAIVERGQSEAETLAALIDLYSRQPKLTAKTSTSKINQAYSTPAPMAYVASRLADIAGGTVIVEPSAGNGMLLIERQPGQTVLANELDPSRRERLAEQNIEATGEDATTWTPSQLPDRVIGNPPFGQVMEEGGSNKVFQTPMGETTSIDHAIVLQSLATLTPDGRAVFIIGGPPPTVRTPAARMAYYRSGKAGKFFAHLYGNHRVIDHFTINGDLYEKQGAGWPLDVLVVQGAGRSPNTLPGLKDPRMIQSWEELGNELERTDTARIQLNQLTEAEMRDRVENVADQLEGLSGGLRGNAKPSRNKPAATGNGQADAGNTGTTGENVPRNAGNVADSKPETPAPESVRGNSEPTPTANVAGERQLGAGEVTEYQAPFPATSGVNPAGLLAPINLIGPMSEAMQRLRDNVGGDLVKFVHGKLGYPDGEDISKFFFGDQIDALAQAIYTAENGGALVIGDQTGTGKGRIAAGLMKYAVNNGLIPVFATKDQTLYDAMLDDLADIGAPEIVPVISNTDVKEKSLKGKLADMGADLGRKAFEEIIETGELPGKTNAVFTTYDQIKADDAPGISPRDRARHRMNSEPPPGSWRMEALRKIAPRALFILDESHLAGGQSTTGWRFGELLQVAKHAYYSSATFAKRPDNMGIYFRTNLGSVGGNINGLIELMQAGGVPAMQIGSSMLAQDGQYMRRERSFEGVSFQTLINQDTYERDKELADNYTEGLRAIIQVQERMVQAAQIVNQILAAFGKRANIPQGNRARLESANFSAKLHNLVRQYLLAIKANAAARNAIKAIKEGVPASDGTVKRHKVIVTVENTMESIIDELDASGLPLNFNGVLQMYLNQMRRIKVSGGGYGSQAVYHTISDTPDPDLERYSSEELSRMLVVRTVNPETGEPAFTVNEQVSTEMIRRAMIGAFNEASEIVAEIDLADMPLSPIDAMRQAAEAAGIRTGEMTGRSTGIDREGMLYNRSAAEIRGKLQAKDDFNNSDLDFLVINKTGSTGVSMHASEKFKDKRPRLMMVVQPNLDINEFMQTIGRIHRAGQVELPSYINLQTALPAENRPAAILGRKMSMLNANTTSNSDSEISQKDSTDIFNQYGDEVVHLYLVRNPGLVRLVAQSWPKLVDASGNLNPLIDFQSEENGGGQGYLSRSVTGHLAILPVDEQEAFWETATADYSAKIAYLDAIGQNDLRASALDLKAETVESSTFTPGTDQGSVFARPSSIETVNAQMGRRPLDADAAIELANSVEGSANERQAKFIDRANDFIDAEDARKAIVQRKWEERREEWRDSQKEQRDQIASAVGLIGSFGRYDRDDGTVGYAFIEDVLLDELKPNTPSAQFAVVRTNDSQDRLRIPVSQLPGFFKPVSLSSFHRDRIAKEGWERSWSFGTQQYIVTGNLLAALQELQTRQLRGKVINYTKKDGSTEMGILLSASVAEQISAGSASRGTVETSEAMLTLLDAGNTVRNPSGTIRISPTAGAYNLVVPAARSTGGKFWRDPALLRITGEFQELSGRMIARMDRDAIARSFDYLRDNHNERFVAPVSAPARPNRPKTTHRLPDGAELTEAGNHTLSAPVRAYHGTPHKVDKFTTAKIGTGEGAQAYGWGLYYAEAQPVAKKYAKALSQSANTILVNGEAFTFVSDGMAKDVASYDSPIEWANAAKARLQDDLNDKIRLSQQRKDEMQWLISKIEDGLAIDPEGNGNLYTVELLPDEADFLDWDKPLSEQSEKVKAALAKSSPLKIEGDKVVTHNAMVESASGINGAELYRRLGTFGKRSPKDVSSHLRALGIPGIRYLDGNSRDGGKGTRNYVIFDEKLVRILEENGTPVTVSAPARLGLQDPEFAAALDAINATLPDPSALDDLHRRSGIVTDSPTMEELAQGAQNMRWSGRAVYDEARDRQTHAEWSNQAASNIQADESGRLKNLVTKTATGQVLTAIETKEAQLLMPKLAMRAILSGDANALRDTGTVTWGYEIAGTAQARGLTARWQPHLTPEERHREYIAKAMFTPDRLTRERIASAPTEREKSERVAELEAEIEQVRADALARERDMLSQMSDIANKMAQGREAAIAKAKKDLQSLRSSTKTELDKLRADLAKTKAEKDKAELLAEANKKRIEQIREAFADMGVTLEQVLVTKEARLSILGTNVVKGVFASFTEKERKAVRHRLDGFSNRQISKFNGISIAGLEAIFAKFDAALMTKFEAMAAQGITVEDFEAMDAAGNRIDIDKLIDKDGNLLAPARPTPTPEEIKTRAMAMFRAIMPSDEARKSGALKRTKGEQPGTEAPYGFDLSRPEHAAMLVRAINRLDSNGMDMVYEFWINGLLSGPSTQVANIAGNTGAALLEYGIQRPIAALVNATLFRDAAGPSLGEFQSMARYAGSAAATAFRFAKIAWQTEVTLFDSQWLNKPITVQGTSERGQIERFALPGKFGRVVRIPTRLLGMADEFAKHLVGQLEAAAQAHRIAKAEGLTGDAFDTRVDQLVRIPGSAAWIAAVEQAHKLTFTEELPDTMQKMQNVLHSKAKTPMGAVIKTLLRFIFPFVRTPYNIFKTGLRKTPLGSARMVGKGLAAWRGGRPFFDSYPKAAIATDLAEQLIGYMVTWLLIGAGEGDPDDDKKLLLLTGTRSRNDNIGEDQLLRRTRGGETSILWKGKPIFNYGRYEPFATVIATIVDAGREMKRVKGGTPVATAMKSAVFDVIDQARSKTFLQGFEGLMSLMDERSGKNPVDSAIKFIAQGIVPNLIRQPLRNVDNYARDTRNAPWYYSALPFGSLAEPLYDLYGRPVQKGGSPVSRLFMAEPDKQLPIETADKAMRAFAANHPLEAKFLSNPTRAAFRYKDAFGKFKDMTPQEAALYRKTAGQRFKVESAGVLPAPLAPTPEDMTQLGNAKEKAFRDVKSEMFTGGVAPVIPPRKAPSLSEIFGQRLRQ